MTLANLNRCPDRSVVVLAIALALTTSAPVGAQVDASVHDDDFLPSSMDAEFYERRNRSASATIDFDRPHRMVHSALFGVNTSYFNDTDEIWSTFEISSTLEAAGVGALRYPGGEETSFFHWEHPGVNGYEDIFDAPSTHGAAFKRGPFQATWVAPEQWGTNEAFMNFDEFIAHCEAIGAEPVVGLNLSRGRRHNEIDAGLEDALRWMRYSRDQGYDVTYWYLDNEPWHGAGAYTFDIVGEYAGDVVRYGRAIKAEFPEAKLIVNPYSAESVFERDYAVEFVRKAGPVIDFIDMHWYWGWGLSDWDRWLESNPMTSRTKWMDPSHNLSYADNIEFVREIARDAGHPELGIVALEWNLGPGPDMLPLDDRAHALMHAQMLMEFAHGGIEIACLWPLIWQSRRDVWPEQDHFPSIVEQGEPFAPTRSHDVFRMLSPMGGSTLVASDASNEDLHLLAAVSEDGCTARVAVLSKSRQRRKVTIDLAGFRARSVRGECFDIDRPSVYEPEVSLAGDSQLEYFADRFSLAVFTLECATDR
ncbi:MAG: hypothetical protein AAGI30_01775 [Planctomycetota bacterium]